MPMALDMQAADFDERFASLVAAKRETSADVDLTVADIIDDVRHRGDVALAELSLRFERIEIGRIGLKIAAAEIDVAIGACEKTALEAIKLAHARVMDFHLRQKPADLFFTDPLGVQLGWRWRPIDSVGLYVPGGAATYPSSVIMNAVPAKVAGCWRLPRRASLGWTRSIGSAARRRSPRWPSARTQSLRSTRSSARGTPMSRR